MLKILALGAGVQSSTILLMSVVGELEKLDGAIFADTGWEPLAVYSHLLYLGGEAKKAGIPIYQVQHGDLRADALKSKVRGIQEKGERWASIPLYTRQEDGRIGMIRRQCTAEYKIQPIQKQLRKLAGYTKGQRIPVDTVELWYGISRDEMRRVRISQDRWIVNRYPLIIDIPLTREGCKGWLREHGFPEPPRSACIGCPFHSDFEWRQIKNDPVQWADAVEFDRAIRHCEGMRGQMFLHRSGIPLEEVDFSTAEERGQGTLWKNECLGVCGV